MKFVIISDTHSLHEQITLPEGDALIHCGDWTNRGNSQEIEKFLDWFSAQRYAYKIFIAGNHELTLDYGARTRLAALELIKEYSDKIPNLHYLEKSSVIIDGIKFYGNPASPFFCNWAFNFQRGKDIAIEWAEIPLDTDILVTHGPPNLILDEAPRGVAAYEHAGCDDLMDRLGDLKQLKLHCFGHIHHGYGLKQIGPTKFVNASICTEAYQPTNKPVIVEI